MAGCKRNWAQSSARTSKIRAQFSAQTTQNLLRVNDQNLVLWAIDENMGTNLQAFYKHCYIGCLQTQKQQLHFVSIGLGVGVGNVCEWTGHGCGTSSSWHVLDWELV